MSGGKGLILGLHAKARSGKDTFANYLVNILSSEYGREFKTTAFAYRLKQMCLEHFNLNREQLWGDDKEKIDLRYSKIGKGSNIPEFWTPREIMQNLGSFYRSIDYDFWVRKTKEHWEYHNYPDVVITDVRHINECEYVKENGILIKIVREDANEIHNMQHESETALDNQSDDYFDITVFNNGTLEDLQKAAEEAAEKVLWLEKLKEKGREYNGE